MLNPELIDSDSLASQLALEELPPKLLITGRWPRPPSIYVGSGELNPSPQAWRVLWPSRRLPRPGHLLSFKENISFFISSSFSEYCLVFMNGKIFL